MFIIGQMGRKVRVGGFSISMPEGWKTEGGILIFNVVLVEGREREGSLDEDDGLVAWLSVFSVFVFVFVVLFVGSCAGSRCGVLARAGGAGSIFIVWCES